MERRASRPYINNHTAPPYSNTEQAIEHQYATITYIERRNNWYKYSGPRLNTTDAVYTTDDANGPSCQLPEPEDATCPGQDRAQRAMAQPEPYHGSPATRCPGAEALAPGDSTKDKLEVPQQEQGQGQQGPRELKRTDEDDGHTDSSASSVPLMNSKPQSRKRKRVEKKEEQEEPEQEKENDSGTKKVVKAKGGKPKEEKEHKFVCDNCGERFKRNEHLTRHEENAHGIEMEGGVLGFERFPCGLCGKWLTRKDNLKSHRNTKHPGCGPAPVPKSVFVDAENKIIANARVLRRR
ncbi:hypothetical protein INS49_014885 [Diaporthe citri]|uniref:uncharacterized protein n=1 Tax=Diaporthe citri TaxID=83186 RepID=UPI001C7E9CFE|nr:uncharacterized protein INS49_014885 [Diaporthe citri]KAG6357009.1 hypothetical protein INS49_014885 [Diaporthe citri]